ncbi:helix-turn-helix domain-containing protein [Lactococcus lactis]|uniref:helix-turn-helix domain-containing protein n=1 Tax=Lactococcus lactis TaxID=1358 RepID=UPI003D0BD0AB
MKKERIKEICHLAQVFHSTYKISVLIKDDKNINIALGNIEVDKNLFPIDYDMSQYWIEDLPGFRIGVHPLGAVRCTFESDDKAMYVQIGPVMVENINPLMIYQGSNDIESLVNKLVQFFSTDIMGLQTSELSKRTIEQSYQDLRTRLELVQNGDITTLKQLNRDQDYLNALFEFCNNEQSTKSMLTFCLYLSMYYAIAGGLPIEMSGAISSYYGNRFSSLRKREESVAMYNSILEHFALSTADYRVSGVSSDIAKAVRMIKRNINRQLTIQSICTEIGLSQYHFMRKFKIDIGMTVGAYIKKEKIAYAKFLLVYTNQSISEISEYLIFNSQSYFTSVFKKETGKTPFEYRKSDL